jgi:hypothetical protein
MTDTDPLPVSTCPRTDRHSHHPWPDQPGPAFCPGHPAPPVDVVAAMTGDGGDNARTTPDNPAATTLNSGPPNASRLDICELPHQTIAEEDDCQRRRVAASNNGSRLALARIASERAHHEHCANLARTDEGGITHSSIAAGLQIAEAHLTAALDGPADTTPPAGSTAREAPGV